MAHVCLFLSSVLKPFDKCAIRMVVGVVTFYTFERSWSPPRFVLFPNKTKIGNKKLFIFRMQYDVVKLH